jgi:hypothetical protein
MFGSSTRDNLRFVFVLISAVLLVSVGLAQQSTSSPGSPPSTVGEKPDQKPANPKEDTSENQAKPQAKITPEQAEQLFRDVDTILGFASKDTSFPIKHEVKRKLVGREEVVSYLKKNMAEDKDVQRLRRTELVLKKFGLLPKTFDLQTFLVALLEEQVAGYYDAKTKTVNLLDWVLPELQRPVLAHELTHALQDQSFGLDKWLKRDAEDLDSKKDLTPDDITKDENSEAREAIVEGQAMVVLIDYMLAPTHRTVADSPEVVEVMNEGMAAGTADSIQYKNAPIFMKEALTFPYRYGVEFEAEVLRAQGKDQGKDNDSDKDKDKASKQKAFAAVFDNPPRTSREIMEPKTYLAGEHLAPLPLPDFKHIFKNYDRFDVGAIGEFDVAVLVEQYAGEEASKRIYPNWRGGYYYSVHPKGNSAAPLGLVFVSKWASPKAAGQFAAIYARGMAPRYKKVEPNTHSDLDLKKLESLIGDYTWLTEDGAVVIDVKGDTVLVTESLDPPITEQFRHAVLPTSAP